MSICYSALPRKIDFYGFVPVKKNKTIRYKYPWELNWNEIEGDRYSLEKQENYEYGLYEIRWTATGYLRDRNDPAIPVTSYSRVWIRGKPRLDIPISFPTKGYSNASLGCFESVMSYENELGQIKEFGSNGVTDTPVPIRSVGTCIGNSFNNEGLKYGVYVENAFYTSIKRIDQPNPIVSCLFKIYDKNNVVLHEQTEDVCPEVEEIPESCEIDPDSRQFLGTFITNQFIVYEIVSTLSTASLKCSSVVAFVSLLPGVPTGAGVPVAILCSPPDCDRYPLIQYICCDCEECPPNTCRIECGDTICCYDSSGNVVKSFSVQDANCY